MSREIEPPSSAPGSCRFLAPAVCLLLVALVCLVFGRTFHYGFVNYDDGNYVYNNPVILKGLTPAGIKWAFTHSHGSNWHPLTSISHMLDCQFSSAPGWYHLENVLLHAATAALLFLVLREMTGSLWASAFVAAVFAIHPLRVESVAWISERKDVLSGLFFMLTLWAYVRYARSRSSWARYAAVVIFYALGLMSKPTLVTLPFVLLLLDYWPLNRFASPQTGPPGAAPQRAPLPLRLLMEKIPLLILSAACCMATIWAQKGALGAIEAIPLSARIEDALAAYAIYIGQMFYPAGLAVFYPRPGDGVPAYQLICAGILIAAVSTVAFAWKKKRPYLIVGWLWYLGTLVPMIGIMQVGMQFHADRYTYLPQIGLYILLAWGAIDLLSGVQHRAAIFGVAGSLIVAALSITTYKQTSYFHDSATLWLRDLACTSHNPIAHNNYGFFLFQENHEDDAIAQYRQALQIWPGYADAHSNLAVALNDKGQNDEALTHYEIALQLNPRLPGVHNNMANIFYQRGEYAQALAHCEQALQLAPGYADAHCMLAIILSQMGRLDEARIHFQKALELNPRLPEAHNGYARLLDGMKLRGDAITQYEESLKIEPNNAGIHYDLALDLTASRDIKGAVLHYQKALEIDPQDIRSQCNLAWILATSSENSLRDGRKAVQLAQQASQLTSGNNPAVLRTLAAAYAEEGQFTEALATAQKATDLAAGQSRNDVVTVLQREMKLYQQQQPLRQPPGD